MRVVNAAARARLDAQVLDRALTNWQAGRPLTTPQWQALQALWRRERDAGAARVNAANAQAWADLPPSRRAAIREVDRQRGAAFARASRSYPRRLAPRGGGRA